MKQVIIKILSFISRILKRKLTIALFIIIGFYKLLFNSYVADYILKKTFPSFSSGKMNAEVKQFSLFYGIVIENIEIYSGADFENKLFFKTNRLAVLYSIPKLFIGNLEISEISLIKPKIFLYQKGKVWNAQTLFKSEPAKKEEPEKENSESTNEINLPAPVRGNIKIFIEDMDIDAFGDRKEKFFVSKIHGFTLRFFLNTQRFNKIPLSIKALSLLEKFKFEINPDKELSIELEDEMTSLKTPFNLKLIIDSVRKENQPFNFVSIANIGHESIPLKIQNKIAPFGFQFYYNFSYAPDKDEVLLNDLFISISNQKWIEGKGKILKLFGDMEIDFELTESLILFEPLSKIFTSVPIIPPMDVKGSLSLKPFYIKGKLKDLTVRSEINGKGIDYVSKGQRHSLPFLGIKLQAGLDLLTEEKPTESNILPMVKYIDIDQMDAEYNGILLKTHGHVSPKSNVDVSLKLDRINIHNFVPDLTGSAKLNIDLKGDNLSVLKTDLKAILEGLRYSIGKSVSGINSIEMSLKTIVDLSGGFKLEKLDIKPLDVFIKNENKGTGIHFGTTISADFTKGSVIKISSLNLSTDITELIPTLPVSLRTALSGVRSSLGNNLSINGVVGYSQEKSNSPQLIDLSLDINLPAIEMTDLNFSAKIIKNQDTKETINLEKFSISAFNGKMKGDYKGILYKPNIIASAPFGEYTADIKGYITLESEIPRYILKGITFKGDLDINLEIKDFLIKGSLYSNDSFISYKSGCPGKNCQSYDIKSLKMDIPFLHNLGDKSTANLLEGNKSNFVKTYGNNLPPNLTIQSIEGTHPTIENSTLEFISQSGKEPGFSARVDYTENFLTIDNLKIKCMDGFIYGKDILFNIGSGDPEKIQYTAIFQIRDIDLKPLVPKNSRDNIDDGKIKTDINISGYNLSDPIGNMNLFFSTYQIGEDFGVSAIKIVSPANLLTDAILKSYNVDKLEIELTKGLVYATIRLKKSILNTILFGVENDQIAQERIPLASFLKRAQNELSNYK